MLLVEMAFRLHNESVGISQYIPKPDNEDMQRTGSKMLPFWMMPEPSMSKEKPLFGVS